MTETIRVKINDRWYTVEVGNLTERPVRAVVDGYVVEVNVPDATGQRVEAARPEPAGRPAPRTRPRITTQPARPAAVPPPASDRPAGAVVDTPPNPNKVFAAPMPGTILSIAVKPGDQVVTGDVVCVLEAMKMQQVLRADWSGVIKTVLVTIGQQVMDGTPIVELE